MIAMIFRNSNDLPEDSELFENRTKDEILAEVDALFDKIWLNRHLELKQLVEDGEEEVDPKIWSDACKNARKIEEKYGLENLGPYDDFEWGMLNGKLSALRWLLGYEWDMLDT
jgi:hypothetical protein